MSQKIDIVIPLGRGSKWENNELRYCLRSVEKNFLDLGKVYIVGERPRWLQNVTHIKADDIYTSNKDANIITKVSMACRRPELSKKFVRLSDDQLFMKPITAKEMKLYHGGDLKDRSFRNARKWQLRLENTMKELQAKGLPTLNFDTHCPMIVDKDRFLKVFKGMRWNTNWPGVTINTWYYNHFEQESVFIKGIKATLEGREKTKADILKKTKNCVFLGYNNKALRWMKFILPRRFPDKSRFEV